MHAENITSRGFGAKRHGAVEPDTNLRLAAALNVFAEPRRNFDGEGQRCFAQTVVQLAVTPQG